MLTHFALDSIVHAPTCKQVRNLYYFLQSKFKKRLFQYDAYIWILNIYFKIGEAVGT